MIHSGNSSKKIFLTYIITLLPLIIYGLYKNGLFVYLNYNNDILYIIKPLIIIIGSVLLGFIFDKIFKTNRNVLIALLISVAVPISINIYIYFIILGIGLWLSKYFKSINVVVIIKLFVMLIMYLLSDYTYLNDFQLNNEVLYNGVDLLLGNAHGGIGNTLIIYYIFAYIILLSTTIYKWGIPLIIIGSYSLISCIFIPFVGFNELVFNMFNSQLLFVSVFVATIPFYSPIKFRHIFIYSLLIGLLASILVNLVSVYEGVYMSLALVTLFIYLSKLYKKYTLKNQ